MTQSQSCSIYTSLLQYIHTGKSPNILHPYIFLYLLSLLKNTSGSCNKSTEVAQEEDREKGYRDLFTLYLTSHYNWSFRTHNCLLPRRPLRSSENQQSSTFSSILLFSNRVLKSQGQFWCSRNLSFSLSSLSGGPNTLSLRIWRECFSTKRLGVLVFLHYLHSFLNSTIPDNNSVLPFLPSNSLNA